MWVEIIVSLVTGLVVTSETRGLVNGGFCMMCTCVRQEGGGEKSVDTESLFLLSFTLRYVSLTDSVIILCLLKTTDKPRDTENTYKWVSVQ